MKHILLAVSIITSIILPVRAYGIPHEVLQLEEEMKNATGVTKIGMINKLALLYLNYDPARSLKLAELSLMAARQNDYEPGEAYALHIIGRYYMITGDYEEADDYLDDAADIYEDIDHPAEAMRNYYYLGYAHFKQEDERWARKNMEKSLKLAYRLGDREYQMKNYEALFETNYQLGDHEEALKYFKLYIEGRNQQYVTEQQQLINNLKSNYESEINQAEGQINNLEQDKEVLTEEKQVLSDSVIKANQLLEIATLENELSEAKLRNERMLNTRYVILALALGGLSLLLLLFYRQKRRDNKRIAEEKRRVEELLLNILPAKVVDELKEKGVSHPEDFRKVTVFFSDFAGFTELSSRLEPKELIAELNEMFTEFDRIMETHGCERIKTIGDAYLAVCGMPRENEKHVESMLMAAIEIRDYLEQRNSQKEIKWHIRIGIHSGHVIGGIVGTKKYIYDVFGDTINTASRMESNSEPGRINVSEQTRRLTNGAFRFEDRGSHSVKGKGRMRMYFLEGKN